MPMDHSEMEQELRSLREGMRINAALLAEAHRSEDRAKQSEDRLYRTVLVVFSVVGVIFVALLGYNTWNITTAYNDLLDRVNVARSSLETQYQVALTTQSNEFKTLEKKLLVDNDKELKRFLSDTHQANAARFVGMSDQIAGLWQYIRKPEHSLEIAIEAFNKAMESGSSLWAGALRIIDRTLKLASMDKHPLSEVLLSEVQSILETPSIQGDPLVKTVQETLKSYRSTLNP